jgi:hypothetical protein
LHSLHLLWACGPVTVSEYFFGCRFSGGLAFGSRALRIFVGGLWTPVYYSKGLLPSRVLLVLGFTNSRSPGLSLQLNLHQNQHRRPILRPFGDDEHFLPDCLQVPRLTFCCTTRVPTLHGVPRTRRNPEGQRPSGKIPRLRDASHKNQEGPRHEGEPSGPKMTCTCCLGLRARSGLAWCNATGEYQ